VSSYVIAFSRIKKYYRNDLNPPLLS